MHIHFATIFNFLRINLPQQQNRMATTRSAILAILTLVVPLLLDLIELKFQKESISAFEAHPIATKVAIAASQLFGLSFTLEEYFAHLSPTPAALLRTSMVFSGSLLVASLVSILSSDEWRPVIYVIYIFLSLGNYLYRLVRRGCEWVQGIMDKLQTLFTRMQQRHLRRSPAILPLTNMDTGHGVRIDTNRPTASTSLGM
ncbi:hypothetical protein PVL29_019468 [Vitis rotundifolia]|uniref:Transmembrane protein n=1 Tax=Vitis rotundifolia TaxID=103349 RepID=A0AA38Z0M5_VITRO|nr:hypothetical protein PVL29_019464 [Vitis rotundifolia]KAJ9680180.1 hypothetical protein PVL29_019468 [Vitis rotundifolia]